MSDELKVQEKSIDPAVQQMISKADEKGIVTVWDRYEAMTPQCGFGDTGLCCRHCLQGPCRINPFGEEPKTGICGATADVMVARGLDRAIAAGTAAHSGHAKHLAHTMMKMAKGEAKDYSIKDGDKLKAVAGRLGIAVEGREDMEIAKDVAAAALADFHEKETPVLWAATVVTPGRVKVLSDLGAVPKGIDHEVSEIMHRTLYGVDADAVNLLIAGIRCGVADLAGCYMGTDLADIMFGTPTPVVSKANMGTLKQDMVNIAVHGHNPVLSEIIVAVADDMKKEAVDAGAAGINIVGVCCTGNELMERHGIPSCTHSVSQEMAMLTGAVDAMVVDYQCIMPSVVTVAECMGTKIVTTMDLCKITGAEHIEFREEAAVEKAKEVIRVAIEVFDRRKGKPVDIPDIENTVIAGFSVESIVAALSKLDAEDPLKPLVDNIKNGNIRGVCLFAGCNNVKVPQDKNFKIMAERLLKENVLVVATGCGAGALMRHGFMDPANVDKLCGEGLKAVLTAIGEANGLNGPLPPVLHLGSCVDNSRAVALTVAVANYLGVDTDKLPVVASAAEAVSEKAVSIGVYAVAAGLPTHVGVMLPVLGSPAVTEILTDKVKELTGGYFIVDLDPESSADKLLAAIDERRKGLGL
ncbi:MAG: anaerobic carbon-monoxide dehydrogenase catalytic subunit [Deltaproteobacteria bacterium]|uniref:Carbon monoxide dehydrogenase n=1 Tax=Candidatus Desulfacyla euxinica TaxID=2841693 RepID=A0A8J6MZ76_9DELT|nr:anaerobic carbon-monoxide dehydrogenase catalytic subunit [Candidatus Desulfacyla euxinica]MBL7216723.1 anaerobic carbon-monoxide dehydrogenase catalytic subunit [Desulfobacteraceae bacterium]